MYLNPTLLTRLESNPFKSESRGCPVDFHYPLTRIEETEILIPSGFEVAQLPGDVGQKIRGAQISKSFSVEGNLVKCRRELAITRLVFPVERYQELRDFYQEVVSGDQLMVTLAKKQE